MTTVVQLTEKILLPIRQVMPRRSIFLQDKSPLFAIVVVVFIRGLFMWILGDYSNMILPARGLLFSMLTSITMAILLISELVIALLFTSIMITRRGVLMSHNGAYLCFKDRTFDIFRFTQRFIKTENLTYLFLLSSVAIILATGLAASLTNLSILYGIKRFALSFIIVIFTMLETLLNAYMFVLILAILSSWIGADSYSSIVQIVRAMSDPYLDFFRRLFPWARIDFIDLSPIFAFLCLNPLLFSILESVSRYLKFIIFNDSL